LALLAGSVSSRSFANFSYSTASFR
jgi:hypothetical protein